MSDEEKKESPVPKAEFTILGQLVKIPMNVWSFLCITSVCTLIGVIFYLDYKHSNDKKKTIIEIVSAGFFKVDKEPKKIEAKSYTFWTQGVTTFDDLKKEVENKNLTEYKFKEYESHYKLDNGEKTLVDFGNALKNRLKISGYTRIAAYGEGVLPLKSGWIWKITVSDDNEEFTIPKLLAIYKEFFHGNQEVYIETVEIGKKYLFQIEK